MNERPLLILFANLKGNLGDFAILHSMLQELERRHPGRARHVMTHGQHGVDDPRFRAFVAAAPAFEYLGRTPFRRISRALSVFKRLGLGKRLARRLIEQYSTEFAALPPASAASNYEAVYFAGGEQWSGFSNGISQLAVLHAVARGNRKLELFPFSVKRRLLVTYDHKLLENSFALFGSRLVVRDSHSAETMRHLHPDVRLGADCVFALADIGAAVQPARPADGAVTLALTTGEGSRRADMQRMIEGLLAAGRRVRLLTTCEREDGADMQALSNSLGVEYLAPMTWQETVAEFKASALVVTNRLHCMIFTLFADVPLLPMLNREKVTGITRDARLPHALQHAAELTPAKVETCLTDREAILVPMRRYLAEVRRKDLAP